VTVYFVDEDYVAYEAWIEELRLRQWDVQPVLSADEAFRMLHDCTDAEAVIIDVMLAVEDIEQEQFSRRRTDEYLETGLRLLEDLCDQNPAVFPERAVLLTNTINDSTYRAAVTVARRFAVPLWDKADVGSPFEFGSRVDQFIKQLP
jgi:hypothetical protein